MMSCPRRRGEIAVTAFLFLVTTLLVSPRSATAELSKETVQFNEWVDDMSQHFEQTPELTTTKGSGWKPFNRIKWFHEQRMLDGQLPEPGARWAAWEYKRDLERRLGYENRSGGSSWFSLGPANLAGRMLSIAFHPTDSNIVYSGAAGGGVWKTTDGGSSWNPMSDELLSLAVGGIAVSPTDPNIVVIGTGEPTPNVDRILGVGILRSTDAGANWETTSLTLTPPGGGGFHVIEANPANGTLLAGKDDGLYRSTDDGANWDLVRDGGDYYDVQWKPGDANTVFTVKGNDASGNNVKVSTDDGVTWAKAGAGQPNSFLIGKSKIAMSADDPETIYVMYTNFGTAGNLLGVYRSTDGGANWVVRTTTPNIPNGQGWYNLSLAADPNNVDRVIAGGVQLYRSTNGASSFATIGGGVHVDHHVAEYEPGSNDAIWVGSDGGLWRSGADGSSFVDKNNGLITYQFYDICVNNGPLPYYVMGGTQDNGTDKWSGTSTWSNGLGADGMVCNINPINGTTVYAEIQFGGHRKNTNSGIGGYSTIMNGITGTGKWVTPTDQDQNLGNHLYTETSAGIFRTTNGGSNWVNVASHAARWISISPVDGNVIWTVSGTPLYSTDDGTNWTMTSTYGFPTGGSTKILAHPTDVNSALVTFSSYGAVSHVALTTDLGVTWSDVSGDFPSQPVNAIVVDPSNPVDWYIGTDIGVWKSSNGGVNWLPFETGFPNSVVVDLEIADTERKLVAGTHGRGAWEIDIPLGTTDVAVNVDQGPRNMMLDRPFPNPISDRTMLRFAASTDASVRLQVFDVAGRLVSDVVELPQGDGIIRTAPWFATDVKSGVYFAVLSAGGQQITRKMIVTK